MKIEHMGRQRWLSANALELMCLMPKRRENIASLEILRLEDKVFSEQRRKVTKYGRGTDEEIWAMI
jgi:hypothetical protein